MTNDTIRAWLIERRASLIAEIEPLQQHLATVDMLLAKAGASNGVAPVYVQMATETDDLACVPVQEPPHLSWPSTPGAVGYRIYSGGSRYPAGPMPESPGGNTIARNPRLASRNTEIVARHQAGKTYREIAAEYGLTEQRIYQILKPIPKLQSDNRPPKRQNNKKRSIAKRNASIIERAAKGENRAALAADFGISVRYLHYILADSNAKTASKAIVPTMTALEEAVTTTGVQNA